MVTWSPFLSPLQSSRGMIGDCSPFPVAKEVLVDSGIQLAGASFSDPSFTVVSSFNSRLFAALG